METRKAVKKFLGAVGLLGLGVASLQAVPVSEYNWTGGGTAGDWGDSNNWTLASGPGDVSNTPTGRNTRATIPNGSGAITFTAGVPSIINRITTGDGLITFPGGMSFYYETATGGNQGGGLTVGTGGSVFGGLLDMPHGGAFITANGDLTFTSVGWGNTGVITQNAGAFYVSGLFALPIFGTPVSIQAWQFGSGPATIGANTSSGVTSYRFDGTPVFLASQRPNWTLGSYLTDPGVKWDLNGEGLYGDVLTITAAGSPASRLAYLYNAVPGATIDINRLVVGGSYVNSYVNLADTAITIRGAGLAWNNNSTNTPNFDLTANTTVTFDPTGGALSVSTGSSDLGEAGFTDNFAFDNVVIGSGDVVTLTGTANVGGGDSALYVAGTLSGAGTIAGGRNVYVQGGVSPGGSPGILSVVGSLYLLSNAVASIELNGLTLGSGYDAIDVDGSVVISNAVLDLSLGFSPPELSTFTILDNDGSDPVGGYFVAPDSTPLTEGAMWIDGGRFSITYLGGDGNDIVLTSFIPEPSVALLLALGAGLLARRRGQRIL